MMYNKYFHQNWLNWNNVAVDKFDPLSGSVYSSIVGDPI